jgi:hypothetical protein
VGQPWSPTEPLSFAWERVKADPGTILGSLILGQILTWAVGGAGHLVSRLVVGFDRYTELSRNPFDPVLLGTSGFVSLLSWPVSTFLVLGMMRFSLKVARGERYATSDLFSGGPYLLSGLAAGILAFLGVAAGLVLLIVPGVILSLGWFLATPLIVDRGLGPVEALRESWRLTTGHKGNIFVYQLLVVALFGAGLCACCVGVIFVTPIVLIGTMYIYLRITGQTALAPSAPSA